MFHTYYLVIITYYYCHNKIYTHINILYFNIIITNCEYNKLFTLGVSKLILNFCPMINGK